VAYDFTFSNRTEVKSAIFLESHGGYRAGRNSNSWRWLSSGWVSRSYRFNGLAGSITNIVVSVLAAGNSDSQCKDGYEGKELLKHMDRS
jgi:hypothetical protein